MERPFLPSSYVKLRIIEALKEKKISVTVEDDVAIFKRGSIEVKTGYSLLDLDCIDDIEYESLHSEEYINYVVNYIVLTLREMEDGSS